MRICNEGEGGGEGGQNCASRCIEVKPRTQVKIRRKVHGEFWFWPKASAKIGATGGSRGYGWKLRARNDHDLCVFKLELEKDFIALATERPIERPAVGSETGVHKGGAVLYLVRADDSLEIVPSPSRHRDTRAATHIWFRWRMLGMQLSISKVWPFENHARSLKPI
jgi:hypothetical protein